MPGDPLGPVDAVEEPVEDEQQHRDRDQADDRLELLAVLRERLEDELGDEPEEHARRQREQRSAQDRAAQSAARADHARGDRGDDQDRLEALAEDDHRGVGDHRRLARALASLRARLVERLVQDQPGLAQVRDAAVARDQLGEAVDAAGAVPHQSLDLGDQRRVERAQRDLRPELEERVGAEARLLGLVALGGRDRGLHLVEADVDQVEVRLGVRLLPLLRKDPVEDRRRLGVRGLDVLERRDRAALVRVERIAAKLGEQRVQLVDRRRVGAVEPHPRGRRTRRRRRR